MEKLGRNDEIESTGQKRRRAGIASNNFYFGVPIGSADCNAGCHRVGFDADNLRGDITALGAGKNHCRDIGTSRTDVEYGQASKWSATEYSPKSQHDTA